MLLALFSFLFYLIFISGVTTFFFILISYYVFKLSPKFFEVNQLIKIFFANTIFWAIIYFLNQILEKISFRKVVVIESKSKFVNSLEEINILEENFDGFLEKALEYLINNTKLSKALFFIEEDFLNEEKGVIFNQNGEEKSAATYVLKSAQNFEKKFLKTKIMESSPIINILKNCKKELSLKLMTEQKFPNVPEETIEECKTRFKIFGVNHVWPVFVNNDLKGFLLAHGPEDLSFKDRGIINEFIDIVLQRVKEELGFEKILNQYSKVFLLTGQISELKKSLDETERIVSLLNEEKEVLTRKVEELERLKTVKEKSQEMTKIEDTEKSQLASISSLKLKIEELEKEKKDLSDRIVNLLEVNRKLVASTANFSSISRDLYEANKAVRESRNYLESLLERMSNGVLGINTEGLIVTYNRQMALLSGLEAEEVLEKSYNSFLKKVFLDAEKISQLVKRSFVEGTTFLKYETNLHSQTGQEIPVNLSIVPLRGEEKEVLGVMVVVSDLSESKKLALETKKRAQLESIQQMTVSLNHEINNPLTSVLCNIQLVLKKLKSAEQIEVFQDLIESLYIAEKEAKRIKKILEDLRKVNEPTSREYLPGVEMIDITGSIKKE